MKGDDINKNMGLSSPALKYRLARKLAFLVKQRQARLPG
jgi:hypothetical protein